MLRPTRFRKFIVEPPARESYREQLIRILHNTSDNWLESSVQQFINVSEYEKRSLADRLEQESKKYLILSGKEFVANWIEYASILSQRYSAFDMPYASIKVITHANKYRAIGIPDRIDGESWYAGVRPSEIGTIVSDWARVACATATVQLAPSVHVKGLRPQMRRTYEGLTQRPGPRCGEVDPTRALASRLISQPRLVDSVNNYLQQVGLPYSLEIRAVSNSVFPITYHAFYLRDIRNQVLLGIQDVGFGVGQFVPVAAELGASTGGLLLLEQPELHLHPKMQAELGQLLASAVQQREGFQIIAETHSEHVVLRLMRLVREGKLAHDLVQILYVDQDEEGKSSAIELPLNQWGEFQRDWPNGFFDERLNEL